VQGCKRGHAQYDTRAVSGNVRNLSCQSLH
jgi:hypothetical protein